ncbi:Uncharacterised protein [Amycolatopsis camponoti]|uniref:Uncharacterized protein n=1 Tax=Amycolatopsis camponoti TaxID=2606593 RepID=A0A6I8M1N2_9PSEU|nr:Uncharacterised protein [Amycolatopsis camponoti]
MEPVGVVACGHQQRAGGVGSDAEQFEKSWTGPRHELPEQVVQDGDVVVDVLVASGKDFHGVFRGRGRIEGGAGAQRGGGGDQVTGGEPTQVLA